ncbi:MAG: 6,7-dimethyl-8-ribityllumazine synthase [Lentimicrobiaceae bacterium]|nr:6,7-dimethyl-8-ribityllumazine synthase [Lentimicrobiaceae bacterium]
MEKKKDLSEYDFSAVVQAADKKIALVTAQWNPEITGAMESACADTLLKHGVKAENIVRLSAPGSFELPFVAKQCILKHKADAVICIGCIIQGETRHFDFIAQACANGIMQLGLESNIPVIFGVLTTNNMQQAVDRSGGKYGNKGIEAAVACLNLLG